MKGIVEHDIVLMIHRAVCFSKTAKMTTGTCRWQGFLFKDLTARPFISFKA